MPQTHQKIEFFVGRISRVITPPTGLITQNKTFYEGDLNFIPGGLQQNVPIGRPSAQLWMAPDGSNDVEISPFPLGSLIIGMRVADFFYWIVGAPEMPKTQGCTG